MSVITFKVDLTGPAVGQMERDILKEFINRLNDALNGFAPLLKPKIGSIISQALKNSEMWKAISRGGDLQKLLCIQNPDAALNQIEDIIVNGLIVERTPINIVSKSVRGTVTIACLDDSYKDILSAGNTSYSTLYGRLIPWLEWLLFFGTSTLFYKSKLVETAKGVVITPAPNDLTIPPAYAGVQNDNFLTRILQPLEPKLGELLEYEFSRRV